MNLPQRSLPELVCNQLREAILAQRWRGTLPGIRVLCGEMKVSRQTMMLALRLLEKQGVLQAVAHGKPRVINEHLLISDKLEKSNQSAQVIVVIAHRNEDLLSETDGKLCGYLRELLQAQGLVHRHVTHRHIMRAMGAKTIGQLVEQNPADVYVVLGAHPQCSRAFRKLGVAVVYAGGEQVEDCFPRIASSLTQMCDLSIEHLSALGHQKIVVMLPEGLNSAAKKESEGEKAVGRIFRSYKLPFSTYNCPRWGKTKADFNTAMTQLFRLTPPTALILGDVSHAIRVVCFLMREKLRYPEDVSILVLDEASELREYQPPLSHLRLNKLTFAKVILNGSPEFLVGRVHRNRDLQSACNPVGDGLEVSEVSVAPGTATS